MNDPSDKPDLTFIGTAELIEELMRRHSAIVICREVMPPNGDGKAETTYDYNGGLNTCCGLAHRLMFKLDTFASETAAADDDP